MIIMVGKDMYFVFEDGKTMMGLEDNYNAVYLEWKIPYSEIRDYVNEWTDNLKEDQEWRLGDGPYHVAYDFAHDKSAPDSFTEPFGEEYSSSPYIMEWAKEIEDAVKSRIWMLSDNYNDVVDLDDKMTKAEIRSFLTGIDSRNLTKKAESKKMNPLEKAGISGVASGATIEGLETLMAAESFKGEGTLEPCPHDAGIDSEEVSWLGEGDGVVHITGRCRDCSAEGEGYVQIEFEDGERWKDEMAAEEDEGEELSHEQLRAYFAGLKDKNPKLAKEIEISIKDQSYLPPHSVINKAGFDYEIIEAWADLVAEEDKYAPFERCDECEGEGYILTSYTSATRFDPADGDGEDCGECGGTGEIDPADYMYSNHDGRVDYLAETFESNSNKIIVTDKYTHKKMALVGKTANGTPIWNKATSTGKIPKNARAYTTSLYGAGWYDRLLNGERHSRHEMPPKRTEHQLMEEIYHNYTQWEYGPENLWEDGEASLSRVKQKLALSKRKIKIAEKELGRKVSKTQAIEWAKKNTNFENYGAETFEAKGYAPDKPFYATTHENGYTTVMHPINCGHYKMVMNGTGVWWRPTFYDTIEEMFTAEFDNIMDSQYGGMVEWAMNDPVGKETIRKYKDIKTIGDARKFAKKHFDFKIDFAPCFRKERDYDSKALNALPITVHPFWIDNGGWSQRFSDALREFQADAEYNVEFNEWADQEMMSHGKDISFKDWAKDEGMKHGNTEITEWAQHEDESHDARYGADGAEEKSIIPYLLGVGIVGILGYAFTRKL